MGYTIAVFGAFDVNSFGDSLFPQVVFKELSKRTKVDEMFIFAPYGCQNGYNGNGMIHSYGSFEEIYKRKKIDIIIIGGGELFHNKDIIFKNDYGEDIIYSKGYIWKKPVEYGKKYNIPVVMNGVGMPYEFVGKEKDEVDEIIKDISYISLRDEFSYCRFRNQFEFDKVSLIPDTLWFIREYYEEFTMKKTMNSLKKEFSITEQPYIVLQYGTLKNYEEILKTVEQFSKNENFQMIVLPINACHEDLEVVNRFKNICGNSIVITRKLEPIEIISLISNADIFVGTSLHGNLIAKTYNVPNIIIDMYPNIVSKLDGFIQWVNSDGNIVNTISELWFVLNKCIREENQKTNLKNIKKILELHFDYLKILLEKKDIKESFFYVKDKQYLKGPLKKAFLEVKDKGKVIKIQNSISSCNEGKCNFVFDGCKDYSEYLFCIYSEMPQSITIMGNDTKVVAQNSIRDNIFVENLAKFQISGKTSNEKVEISCLLEDINPKEIAELLYEDYKNKLLHIENLIYKERKNMQEIKENNYSMKELASSNRELSLSNKELVLRNKELMLSNKELLLVNSELKTMVEELNQEIEELRDVTVQLKQDTLNKQGHIDMLLQVEREFESVKRSFMFKSMRLICQIYDFVMIVPRFIGRNIFAFCKMLTHVNIPKLKIAWGYCKNEGLVGAYHHLMRDYHQGNLKKIEISIEEKIYDQIKSIDQCDPLVIPTFEQPMVSIIIPVYNQFTFTYYCIKSIIENSGNVSYEIILADDCSNDLTIDIQSVITNLKVLRTPENLRFLRNCNHAAKEAVGKYILFLNNDTEVQKNWLQPLVDLTENNDDIGMVGSKLVYSDGSLQEAGGIVWSDGSAWNYGRNKDAMMPEYNYVKEVDYISGASIMIRGELWNQIGGFDELFTPAYCEDSDLAFEVRKAGYKVVYQPLSVVVHYEGKSNGTDLNSGVKKYQVENNIKLQKKWKDELKKQNESAQNIFKARERSKDKKVILVIDHYVPQFDKDAGSKTTFQYIKMFVKQGYSVKFMGDNFYQHEPYTTILQQMGVEVLYGPWYAQHWKEWILENQTNIDFVYLNRPHIAIKYIDFLKKRTNIKCIYYGHDLHFLRLKREYELTGNVEKLKESEEWMRKELYIMRCADMSYYPSYIEEEAIHAIDPRIPVKAITAYVYEEFLSDIEMDFSKREGIVFVGGFGHPPNEDAVLWFAENVYPLIREKKEIPFYIVGSNATDKIKALNSKDIIVKGYVSEDELRQIYNSCKMVVVPLRYGAGVKGKVVEALYYGLPMVSTTVGVEGITGIENIVSVTDDAKAFAENILFSYEDNEYLEKSVDVYQDFVKEKFSIDAVWNIVAEDFR